jgi:preprotein translocase subunit SecA
MAGRGTDIILGGNAAGLAKLALLRLVYRHLLAGSTQGTLLSCCCYPDVALNALNALNAVMMPMLSCPVAHAALMLRSS